MNFNSRFGKIIMLPLTSINTWFFIIGIVGVGVTSHWNMATMLFAWLAALHISIKWQ